MRILVVEDGKHIADAVKRGLEGHGYAVDVALTRTDGHWLATENLDDAIVLDSMLPGMSGEELCGAMREGGDWTPILMLTAKCGARELLDLDDPVLEEAARAPATPGTVIETSRVPAAPVTAPLAAEPTVRTRSSSGAGAP